MYALVTLVFMIGAESAITRHAQLIAFFFAPLLTVALLGRPVLEQLRWFELGTTRLARTLGLGLTFGLGAALTIEVLQWAFDIPSDTAEVLSDAGVGTDPASTLSMIGTVCLIAPIAEEIYFRGAIFRMLRDGLSKPHLLRKLRGPAITVIAIVVSGFAHVSIHQVGSSDPALALLYFGLATAFALAYLIAGSLTAAVLAHAVNNACAVTLALATMDITLGAWIYALPAACGLMAALVSLGLGRLLGPAGRTR